MNSSPSLQPDIELDISECYMPDDDEDDGLIEPTLKPESEADENHVWLGTAQNRQFVEAILRKINYKNFEDVLFSSDVKLFTFIDKSWVEKGVGLLKIVRQLEEGPCHGSVRLVAYQQGTMATLVNHTLEEEMKVKPYLGRANAVVWNSVTSTDAEGCTYAAVFLPENGVSLARDFISKFEAGQKMTMDTRLGIKGREKLRVTHRSSLVLKYESEFRPHAEKRRKISVD